MFIDVCIVSQQLSVGGEGSLQNFNVMWCVPVEEKVLEMCNGEDGRESSEPVIVPPSPQLIV